jgi:hypothetical protein
VPTAACRPAAASGAANALAAAAAAFDHGAAAGAQPAITAVAYPSTMCWRRPAGPVAGRRLRVELLSDNRNSV